MAQETYYTAATNRAGLTTANPNLDGSGTIVNVFTAGENGALIKTITIKAIVSTTHGMIRFFLFKGSGSKYLISEVEVPAITQSATDPAFEVTIPVDFVLQSGYSLRASTENAEGFIINVEVLNWEYNEVSARFDSSRFYSWLQRARLTTGNSALNGTGTLNTNIWTIVTAPSDVGGLRVDSITIKATGTVTAGMIRLFTYNGSNTRLLMEIPVEATTQSGTAQSFSRRIDFGGKGFNLAQLWQLRATTQNSEAFDVTVEGLEWNYPYQT